MSNIRIYSANYIDLISDDLNVDKMLEMQCNGNGRFMINRKPKSRHIKEIY